MSSELQSSRVIESRSNTLARKRLKVGSVPEVKEATGVKGLASRENVTRITTHAWYHVTGEVTDQPAVT